MKKKIILTISFLILSFSNLTIFSPQIAVANLIYIPEVVFSGGLIPKDNNSLVLSSANVKIDVNTSNLRIQGETHFNGNYTIFNPENEINMTIGAPFKFGSFENCTVLLNGTEIPFITKDGYELQQQFDSELWEDYMLNQLPGSPHYEEFWILCDIIIPKNSSVKLEYDFIVPGNGFAQLVRRYYIMYDVGTERLWKGNITEVVEINVCDNLPTSIYYEDLCSVSNNSEIFSYKWEWIEERIDINFVGLYYYANFEHEYDYLYNSIKFSILLVISLVGILLFIMKYYSNIKTKNRNKRNSKLDVNNKKE